MTRRIVGPWGETTPPKPRRCSQRAAERATVLGLFAGRIYHAHLPSGETLTVGRHRSSHQTATERYAIHGYNLGACRTEFYASPNGATARLFELSHGEGT